MSPDSVIFYFNRAESYNNKKEYEKAISDCNKAEKMDPTYDEIYKNRAAAYRALESKAENTKTKATYKKLAEKDEKKYDVLSKGK